MSDTITWIRPSGTSIEMPKSFNADTLKKLGWKKKPGPKPQAEQEPPTVDLLGESDG